MPRRRKAEVDPQLLKELADLRQRMRETDRRIEDTLQRAAAAKKKLDRIASGR